MEILRRLMPRERELDLEMLDDAGEVGIGFAQCIQRGGGATTMRWPLCCLARPSQ